MEQKSNIQRIIELVTCCELDVVYTKVNFQKHTIAICVISL